eukprot:TRINITY_DN15547_c0_g1_i1.p1 TRINITY_DN15547_c0_g1~~TRINITY_DN15547_c0_g1_i1.p1  ORF type:complete len:1077 (-),score=366.82 TRINITY_DN15547_c0_g1_i1:38-3268(-)
MSTSVRVIVRFRPVNQREAQEFEGKQQQLKLEFPDDITVNIYQPGMPKQSFNFDHIFSPLAMQPDIYEKAAKLTISDVIAGFNGTIFAYGQTGSGKTFTMLGEISQPDIWGIIPRAAQHIFQAISEDKEGSEWTIKCSYLEIYKEQINDLLNTASKNLKVHESPAKGVYVADLTEEFIQKEEDIIELLTVGGANRAVTGTLMNAQSSRSHSLFTVYLQQRAADGTTKQGKLNLVDLAGSEKISKTGAKGETLEEAKKINQSLSSLGNCIHALTEKGRNHVPFRDSKLTRILQESLGGNCKTTLLCACSPHEFNIEETISTLLFAKRAKTIKTSAHVNATKSAAELQRIVDALKRELAELRRYAEGLEKTIEWMKTADYAPGKTPPFAASKRPGSMVADASETAGGDEAAATGRAAFASVGSVEGDENVAPRGHELAETVVELESVKAAQQNKIDTLTEEMAEIRLQLEQQGTASQDLVARAVAAEQKVAETVAGVEAERAQWLAAKQKMEYEYNERQLELDSAIDEMEDLQKRIDQLTAELSKTRSELSTRSEAEVNQLKVAQTESDARLASTSARLKQVEAEVGTLKSRGDELELENEDLHEFVAQVEAEKEQVSAERTEAQTQLKLKAQQLEALESSLRAAKATAHEFEAQVAAAEAAKETAIGRYEAELKKQRQAVKDQETRVRALSEQISRLETEATVHDEGLLRLKTANADLEQTISALQKSNAALRLKASGSDDVEGLARDRDEAVGRLSDQLKYAAAERQREVQSLNVKYETMQSALQAELKKVQGQRDELQLQVDNELASLRATSKRAEELAAAAKRRAEAAEQDLQNMQRESAIASDSAQQLKTVADRLLMEKGQLEGKLQSEEARLAISMKKHEELIEELAVQKASNDDMKMQIESLQRQVARGGDITAVREVAERAEAKQRELSDRAERAESELAREQARSKTTNKRLEQQSERLAEVEAQLRELINSQSASRLDIDKATARAEVAEKARDAAVGENKELRSANEELAKRAIRSGRVVKPITSKTISTPFTQKEDFGLHLLRSTNSKILADARAQAAAAAGSPKS